MATGESANVHYLFQYPLSDRSWWDAGGCGRSAGRCEVSVSSIGSILVGHLLVVTANEVALCFSILYRIDLGGTVAGAVAIGKQVCFSILYRIDLGGTITNWCCCLCKNRFQYPLSDRSWWDPSPRALSENIMVMFQYPLSDRSWWDAW